MKHPLYISLALLSTSVLNAQTSAKATMTTDEAKGYAVTATTGSTTKSDGIADQTTITTPRFLGVRTDLSRASTGLQGSTRSRWGVDNTAWVRESGAAWKNRSGTSSGGPAGTAVGDDTSATAGSHSVVVNFDVAEGKEADVRVAFYGTANGSGKSSVSIDVDGDGTSDFDAATDTSKPRGVFASKTFRLKAGKDGINIRITTEGSAALGSGDSYSNYSASTSAKATTPRQTITCKATAYGKECGGKLEAEDLSSRYQRILVLKLTGAPAGAVGFLTLGDSEASISLPGSPCKLLTNAQIVTSFRADSSGTARQWLRTSLASQGTLYAQDIILDFSNGLKLSSTNGLKIECKVQ